MIIQLSPQIAPEALNSLKDYLLQLSFKTNEVRTQRGHYFIAIGKREVDLRSLGLLPGVEDVFRVSDHYKLVSRKWKAAPTIIEVSPTLRIAEGELTLIAGPCCVEGEEEMSRISQHLVEQGIRIMRGGAFKPRTSPYSFRGPGLEGLKSFHQIAQAHGLAVISEVMDPSQIEAMYPYLDIFQVGARNTQNFNLLAELGQVDKPVLIKRGLSGTIEELLQSAEYIFSHGNEQLILCERGIRTFETSYRNTLDINAIPILKEKSHLPVIVDPSHGIGVRRFVEAVALAAVLAGADGLIFEVHEKPEEALSDGQQTLNFQESARLVCRAQESFVLRSSW